MKLQYNVLNGDALKEQFPRNIQGNIIIVRECLVDGNVKGRNLDQLFASRAKFLSENYGGTEQGYYERVAPEFLKIQNIHDSDINLWFEDDLFCQVNFWFVVYLITKTIHNNNVYLVRPTSHNQYGFGGLNHSELISIYKNRIALTELDKVANLWVSYQNEDVEKLVSKAQELKSSYPFILPAVEAHIERKATNKNKGRPTQTLMAIMKELKTEEFGPVFREFSRRESIYGFGDLQVKRLFDEIKNSR